MYLVPCIGMDLILTGEMLEVGKAILGVSVVWRFLHSDCRLKCRNVDKSNRMCAYRRVLFFVFCFSRVFAISPANPFRRAVPLLGTKHSNSK